MSFQIGSAQFISMDGELTRPQYSIQRLVRDGVNGVLLRRGGKRAEPCEIITTADSTTKANALALGETYAEMVNAGALIYQQDGYNYNSPATGKVGVHVLHVEIVDQFPVRCLLGGLNVSSGSAGWLTVARWILQPVEVFV
jgi:hypothetical protein